MGHILYAIALLFIWIGILVSRASISMGWVLLGASAILVGDWHNISKTYFTRLSFLGFGLYFGMSFLSLLWTNDKAIWVDRIINILPLLTGPLCIAVLPRLRNKYIIILSYLFVAVAAIVSMAVMINYLMHFDQINGSYLSASSIPTPMDHIRFSLALVIACVIAWYLYNQRIDPMISVFNRVLMVLLCLFFITMIHIIASRSGLLAFYLIAISDIVFFSKKIKRKHTVALLIIGLLCMPYLAYCFLPSLQNKFRYVEEDLGIYQLKYRSMDNFSDSRRLTSIVEGVSVWKENFWLGVGLGDVNSAMEIRYRQNYPDWDPKTYILPHNQWIYTGAAIGVFGIVFLGLVLISMIAQDRICRYGIASGLGILLFSSTLSESTLSLQIGSAILSGFLLFFLKHKM